MKDCHYMLSEHYYRLLIINQVGVPIDQLVCGCYCVLHGSLAGNFSSPWDLETFRHLETFKDGAVLQALLPLKQINLAPQWQL